MHEAQVVRTSAPGASTHWPCLLAAVAIMVLATLDPRLLAHASGGPDHRLAGLVFLAMSAAFVRGVGFVPRARLWRALFSGWTCVLALALAAGVRWGL
jgi:predicted membrane protein